MEEKLLQQLDSVLVFIEKSAQATIDFSQEQIPVVTQELLAWNFTMSLIIFCFWLILAIFFYIIGIVLFSNMPNIEDKVAGCMSCFFCGFIFTIFALLSNAWLQILIAPKVWLLEYATSLLTK